MARPGSANPDYNESLFPDERSSGVYHREGAAKPTDDEFKHTHYYVPIGWDQFSPKPHPGSSAIAPNSPVQSLGRMGPGKGGGSFAFRHVRDASGNHQSVHGTSLMSKKKFTDKMEQEREQLSRPHQTAAERLGYGPHHRDLEAEAEQIHGQYFNDRRNEGRRERPM